MNSAVIKSFQNYVLRTPAYPLSVYTDLVADYKFEDLLLLFNEVFLKQALQIASPDLVEALNKYSLDPKKFSIDKKEALEISLLKYLARICSLYSPVQNSGKIKVGQKVNIRLANYPDREFGIIKGTIKAISLTPDKDGNLLINVSLPNGLQTSYKKQISFQ